jgi:hypothetical protein
MLEITRGRVYVLLNEGKLDRHSDGRGPGQCDAAPERNVVATTGDARAAGGSPADRGNVYNGPVPEPRVTRAGLSWRLTASTAVLVSLLHACGQEPSLAELQRDFASESVQQQQEFEEWRIRTEQGLARLCDAAGGTWSPPGIFGFGPEYPYAEACAIGDYNPPEQRWDAFLEAARAADAELQLRQRRMDDRAVEMGRVIQRQCREEGGQYEPTANIGPGACRF